MVSPEPDTAACSDERLKELGIAKLMHRKKFVGKVVEQAKQARAHGSEGPLGPSELCRALQGFAGLCTTLACFAL